MRVHGWMLVSSVPLTACGGGDDADDDGGGPSFTHPAGVKADSVNPGGGPLGISMVPGTIHFTRLYQQSLGRWTLGDGGVKAASVGNAPTDVDVAVQRLFVADQLDSRISVLGQNSGAASDPIPISGTPFRVRASPSGDRVLVTTNTGTVALLDPIAQSVIASADRGEDLNGIGWWPDGSRVFVSSMQGPVVELDAVTLAVTRTLPLTSRTQEIAVSPDGTQLWVADEIGALRVFQVSNLAPLGDVTNADGVFGLAISPDGAQVIATRPSGAAVLIIDAATRTVQATLPVAPLPRRVRYSSNGARAYVTTESGWVYEIR